MKIFTLATSRAYLTTFTSCFYRVASPIKGSTEEFLYYAEVKVTLLRGFQLEYEVRRTQSATGSFNIGFLLHFSSTSWQTIAGGY